MSVCELKHMQVLFFLSFLNNLFQAICVIFLQGRYVILSFTHQIKFELICKVTGKLLLEAKMLMEHDES